MFPVIAEVRAESYTDNRIDVRYEEGVLPEVECTQSSVSSQI